MLAFKKPEVSSVGIVDPESGMLAGWERAGLALVSNLDRKCFREGAE